MKLVGVECWADKYFFGKLLNNDNLIRKENGDDAVIDGVAIRSKENFSIGIVDIDKNKKIPQSFAIIHKNENTQIFKHSKNCQYLILIGPRQFEHWINEYLETKNRTINSFGFISFVEFMKQSKSLKPENDERFKMVINFVLDNYQSHQNHILLLKKQLDYIISTRYKFDLEEFEKIKWTWKNLK